MKRKLAIAMLALGVVFSSVISVAAVSALVREKSRHDFMRSPAYERARRVVGGVEYVQAEQFALSRAENKLAQVLQEPTPPAGNPADQPPAPRPARRGVPAPAEPLPIPINAPRDETQFPERDYTLWERSSNAMRLGQNLTMGPNDVVRDAVVIF